MVWDLVNLSWLLWIIFSQEFLTKYPLSNVSFRAGDIHTYGLGLSRSKLTVVNNIFLKSFWRERSGSVVERLTRDRRAAGSSLTGLTALCPWARHINPSLVLVQPRKTSPFITERLLMGRKESNQTKTKSRVFDKVPFEQCVFSWGWQFKKIVYQPKSYVHQNILTASW